MYKFQEQFRTATNSMKQRPIRLVLLGGPGAGKGTQSELIKKHYNVEHLSTGDLLRAEVAAGSEVGQRASALMAAGKLVDDVTMIDIIRNQLSNLDAEQGWILDGFPRTIPQAEALDKLLRELDSPLTGVINFDVDDDTIVRRVCGRWIHKPSGRSYHQEFDGMKPRKMDRDDDGNVVAAYDDETGEALIRRADDNEESIRSRLQSYHEYTKPLLEYYQSGGKLLSIEADDRFETWTIVQLALGPHDVHVKKADPRLSPAAAVSVTDPTPSTLLPKQTARI